MHLSRTASLAPVIALALASCSAPQSRYARIEIRTGSTPEQAIAACRAAGVKDQPEFGSGPRDSYRESYRLSDGRSLRLVTNYERRPARVRSAEILLPRAKRKAAR